MKGYQTTSQLIVNALLEIGLETIVAQKRALITLTDGSLLLDYALTLPIDQVIIQKESPVGGACSPGGSATLSHLLGRRSKALRPTLSSGLLFSDVLTVLCLTVLVDTFWTSISRSREEKCVIYITLLLRYLWESARNA